MLISSEYLLRTDELNEIQRRSMFELMQRHFENVDENIFRRDMNKSQYVIIIENPLSHEIAGFSTQTVLKTETGGRKIAAVYSGDTIVDKRYLNGSSLAGSWITLVKKISAENPYALIYWFLLSKGYMTYMLLPKNFYEFYPKYDIITPDLEKEVLDRLGEMKFGSSYDREKGTIRIDRNYYLKKDIGQIKPEMKNNPHIEYFSKLNPLHTEGIELACIIPLKETNFRLSLRKMYNNNAKT